MKKIKRFFAMLIMALASSAVLVSCGSDDETNIECTVSPTEVVLSSEKGASTSFGITFEEGSSQWKITSVPDFVTVYPQSGSGAGTVKINALGDNDSKYPKEGVITIEVEGTDQQTVKVVQQNLGGCYAEPTNVLTMSNGFAFAMEFGANTKYAYATVFSQIAYNKLSKDEIIERVATGDVNDRYEPENEKPFYISGLEANTSYVVVTVSYAENNRQGDLVVTPITTKSEKNQPLAKIKNLQFAVDESNNYYYAWNVEKNTYCDRYYTYAAASADKFKVYDFLCDDQLAAIAWLLNNEIKKDGEDHSTSINELYPEFPFDMGRDKFYAAQIASGVSYFKALPYSDKYYCVITWGTGNSGELSGVFSSQYGAITTDGASNVKNRKFSKSKTEEGASCAYGLRRINTKDIKLTRLN